MLLDDVSTDIGTRLLFENGRIRVWDMQLEPDAESPLHRHESDYVFIYTTPSRITAYLDAAEPTTNEYEDGYVQFTEVGEGLVPHKIRNSGRQLHRQILVELKGASASSTPQVPADNGRRHRA